MKNCLRSRSDIFYIRKVSICLSILPFITLIFHFQENVCESKFFIVLKMFTPNALTWHEAIDIMNIKDRA